MRPIAPAVAVVMRTEPAVPPIAAASREHGEDDLGQEVVLQREPLKVRRRQLSEILADERIGPQPCFPAVEQIGDLFEILAAAELEQGFIGLAHQPEIDRGAFVQDLFTERGDMRPAAENGYRWEAFLQVEHALIAFGDNCVYAK